jgi:hypothetical protein
VRVNSIQIDMSPIPTVPHSQIAHAVGPGHYKKIQGILIVDLQAMFLNFGTRVRTALQPFCEFGLGIVVSQCNNIQCYVAFVGRNSH